MGVRGELFTTEISLENRTYFFNVKENRTGDVFLQVVESKNVEGSGFDRRAIVVFEDDMQRFLQGLENSLSYIEKNRKARLKEAAAKPATEKRRFVKKDAEATPRTRAAKPASGDKPKRVRVVSKKPQN
ncbi:MAG TPA: DUF3276 family protein [Treponemataceae bacterium]|nr:DUF3276 family protein [Treponemataceae bacterium]